MQRWARYLIAILLVVATVGGCRSKPMCVCMTGDMDMTGSMNMIGDLGTSGNIVTSMKADSRASRLAAVMIGRATPPRAALFDRR
jgi:hypothetical protein